MAPNQTIPHTRLCSFWETSLNIIEHVMPSELNDNFNTGKHQMLHLADIVL